MDLFNILTQTLNNLSLNPYSNDLDFACVLSDSWKNRARTCKADLQACITKKIERVNQLSKEDNYEAIGKEMGEIDLLDVRSLEMAEILEKYKREPLPLNAIEQIADCEKYIYSLVMTDQILKKLLDEIQQERRRIQMINELIVRLDQMWDNNDSEEDMKNYIFERFQEIYPNFDSHRLKSLADEFFIFATQDKNVRVNLSDEQINNLRRETYLVADLGENLEGDSEREVCGTCLEEFKPNDETIVLHCSGSHRYHPDCIIPWLKMSVVCPTCRTDLR